MEIGQVARSLLAEIGAPSGEVNVVPRPRGADRWELDVWVRSSGSNLRIPAVFEGCPVHVMLKPNATTSAQTW